MGKLESVALIFDSGKYGAWYGGEVFEEIFKNNELKQNSKEIFFSIKDLTISDMHIDIAPFTINDDLLTIDRDYRFCDLPYCYIIEDIDDTIILSIDKNLKKSSKGYAGVTRISNKYRDMAKQFWKSFRRNFSIVGSNLNVYMFDESMQDSFRYKELAEKYEFNVVHCNNEFKPSALINSENDYELKEKSSPLERNLIELSISLGQELEIAGSLIWEAITKLNNIRFVHDDIFNSSEYLPELSFMCLYDASQGIERLQKIIILLYCRLNGVLESNEEKLFKLLYSHNHQGLNEFIVNNLDVKFEKEENSFIETLETFYNNYRYALLSCLSRNANSMFYNQLNMYGRKYTEKSGDYDKFVKNKIGNCIGKLAQQYYTIICDVSRKLNIYTYEIQVDSCANVVFCTEKNLYKQLCRIYEAKREILYWVTKNSKKFLKYKRIKKVKSLQFNKCNVSTYLSEIVNNKSFSYLEEFDGLLEDLFEKDKKLIKDRKSGIIKYIIEDEVL